MKRLFAIALLFCGLAAPASAMFFKGGQIIPPPTFFTQNIADNVRGPGYNGNFVSNGTNTTQNLRSAHQNNSGAALTNIGLIYSGWYITASTGEQDLPNSYTVTASVEYPAATFTQVTWSSATSGTVAAGGNLVSDRVSISIPAGAQFWVRTFVSVSGGQVWSGSGTLSGNGEAGETGVGLTDKTMGGTISGSYQGLRPSAIISNGNNFYKLSLATFGDSIMAGQGDGIGDGYGWGWASRACTSNCPIINTSYTGTSLGQQVGHFARRLDMIQKAGITHAVLAWGVNDGALPLSTYQSNITTLMTQIANVGIKAIWTTITPAEGSSTQAFQTVASQTAGPNNTLLGQVNDWIRTTPSPMFTYVENSDVLSSSRNSGLWNAASIGSTFSPYMCPGDSWAVSPGATTTVIPTTSTRPTQYYDFGGTMVWTSGALNGTKNSAGTYQHTGGTFTVSALGSAPAAGDTFVIYPGCAAATNDGVHPVISTDVGSGVCTNNECGGYAVLEHAFMTNYIAGWK